MMRRLVGVGLLLTSSVSALGGAQAHASGARQIQAVSCLKTVKKNGHTTTKRVCVVSVKGKGSANTNLFTPFKDSFLAPDHFRVAWTWNCSAAATPNFEMLLYGYDNATPGSNSELQNGFAMLEDSSTVKGRDSTPADFTMSHRFAFQVNASPACVWTIKVVKQSV